MDFLPKSRKLSTNQKMEPQEVIEKASIGDIAASLSKVLDWMVKNENRKSDNGYYETGSSYKSENKELSDVESVENIKTPTIRTESSEENSKGSSKEAIRRYKERVKPIVLNYYQTYDVQLVNFECLDSFFVILKRESDRKWNRLMRRLKKAKDRLEPLPKIIRGNLCLVKSENELHRAVIQNNNPKYAICLGVDNGKIYILDTALQPIYRMTPKIRNTIQFQAINCKLSGIKLPSTPALTKFVYEMFISEVQNPQIRVVQTKYSKLVDDRCMAMNKYEIMLLDGETKPSVNQEIAQRLEGSGDFELEEF